MLILLGFWIIASACSRTGSEELPIYLELPDAKVKLNEQGGFVSSLGIKDLWVDYGPEILGVFRVPSTVPLLKVEGQDSLLLRGGIFESGLSSIRTPYPFWIPQRWSIQDIQALDTLNIAPTFEYLSSDSIIAFPLSEGFEGASMLFEPFRTGPRSPTILSSREDSFEGNSSGRVIFTEDLYDFEIISTDFIALPQRGNNDVYVEITYKNDVAFTVGFYYAFATQIDIIESGIFFNSGLEWNTVYVHLNDAIRATPNGSLFKLFVRANAFNQEAGKGTPGILFLDNVRIVHFR